nr:unnamed protein product [Haemonchus contortus]
MPTVKARTPAVMKPCTMCGNAAIHREKVQNIMMATMASQMKTLQSGKRLAGVIEELRDLKKTRKRLQRQLEHMMFLWREHLAEI